MTEFKLSAVLQGHTADVRGVLLPDDSFALTASRDGTTRVWKRTSQSPPAYEPDESSHGSQFKTCLAYLPPNKEYNDGLIFSAGQDTLIEARQPGITAEQNADAMMVGHSNQVCSLDVCPEAGWLVSGAWDNTARLWGIGKWETEIELEGHTAAVWAVLAYDKDTVVTGCADQAIRVFTTSGKMLVSIDGKNIIRALARLPENHPTGAQLASGSNDGTIRLWTLSGKSVAELHGHEAFIYSLAVLPSGELVSCGEDRTIRVWKGTECIQVIILPAISVWSVSTSPNGDIIAGSSDKMARIFSREKDRQAGAETISEFEQSVQSSAVPKQQVGEINMTDLPGPEFLTRKRGTKEGQSTIIKDQGGQPTLYQWSMAQNTWVKIGQVVDSAGSSSKVPYQGKEYDYVFDVDIEDGKPPLKLPYNIHQNPYEAATKFLQDNELPVSYLEETANFIIKNTQGATLGQQQPTGADPWGTENRYRPGEAQQSSYQPTASTSKSALPQKDYLQIVLGKPSQAFTQITKLNSEYLSSKPELALAKDDLEALQKVTQQLDKHNFDGKPSLPTSSVEPAMPGLLKIITEWDPLKNQLAGLDLLRFVAVASLEFPIDDTPNGSISALFSSSIFEGHIMDKNLKLAMIGYRVFTNLLYGSPSGRMLTQVYAEDVLRHLQTGSYFVGSGDVSFAVALTTLALNVSVLITSDKTDQSEKLGVELMELLVRVLTKLPSVDHGSTAAPLAQTTEPAYRALVALGTVIVGLGNGTEVKKVAKSQFNVMKVVGELKSKKYGSEPRFEKVFAELERSLR